MMIRIVKLIGKIILELIGVIILACILSCVMYYSVNFLAEHKYKMLKKVPYDTEMKSEKAKMMETLSQETEVSTELPQIVKGETIEELFPITIYDEYNQYEEDSIIIIE